MTKAQPHLERLSFLFGKQARLTLLVQAEGQPGCLILSPHGTEIASLIRRHNDANIIVFPARFITNDEAVKMLDAYFAAEFEGGRHIARIAKMPVAGCK